MDKNKTVILVGGGHAHLHTLKFSHQLVEKANVILVSPSHYHYYSGMAPGMLSGMYTPDQIRFNIKNIIESRGGTFVKGKVVHIDPENRIVTLDNLEQLSYDLVSFNIGSMIPIQRVNALAKIYPVKPISTIEKIQTDIVNSLDKNLDIVIIGGGPAGVEMAANLDDLIRSDQSRATISLVNSASNILSYMKRRAIKLATRALIKKNINILNNFRADQVVEDKIISSTGKSLTFDFCIAAIGVRPSNVFKSSNLKVAQDDSLLVNPFLHAIDYPDIFGGGDCISIQDQLLAKVGVYAVRQGPVLLHNLLSSLKGEPLKRFSSQRGHGYILNLGNRKGLFIRNKLIFDGRLAFLIKNHIDKKFMSEYQD